MKLFASLSKLGNNIVLSPSEITIDENWQEIRSVYNVAMNPETLENISLPQLNSDFLRRIISTLKKDDSDSSRYFDR